MQACAKDLYKIIYKKGRVGIVLNLIELTIRKPRFELLIFEPEPNIVWALIYASIVANYGLVQHP